jgi:hypothetical protein
MEHRDAPLSLNRTAWSATLHCLTGCAIGEVLGMVIGTALGRGNGATIVLAIVLAFLFGYALTLRPLLKAMSFIAAAKIALAADTASSGGLSGEPLADRTRQRACLGACPPLALIACSVGNGHGETDDSLFPVMNR